LIGGETAQMPDMYKEDEYDLAGFAVGIVEKERLLDGSKVKEGDVVIGLASSGLHSNGFSLVRKLLLKDMKLDTYIDDLKKTLGEELLIPTKIYVKPILEILDENVHAMAHITGGGIVENLPRVIPEGLEARLDKKSWEVPVIFHLIQSAGKIEEKEMFRTFNMGIGFILVVEKDSADTIIKKLQIRGQNAWIIGQIFKGERGVMV
ncbi:MAG TPA: phosphoribosylformylglycinamidine cyclo-ligase, partial [Pseudothermotoga sp.]